MLERPQELQPLGEAATPVPAFPARGRRLCLAGLVTALLGLLAGRQAWLWIPADALNHFLPHLTVLALASLLGLVVQKRRLLAAGLALLLGLAAIPATSFLAPLLQRLGSPVAQDNRVIRVMSFNTWLENPNWRAVMTEIERNDPDIVTLVEYGPEKGELQQALAGKYPYQADCMARRYCHMLLLSKFPFVSSDSRTHWRGPPQLLAHFGPEMGDLLFVATHTLRPPYFNAQLKQVETLGDQLAKAGGTRIVMGDFNATPFSRMLQIFTERSGLHRITWLPTWPANFGPFPQVAIDHIFLSDDLAAVGAARLGHNAGSDHYPVIADIRLPVEPPGRTTVGALEGAP